VSVISSCNLVSPLPLSQLQLELAYRGALDVVLHLEAVTLVDTQFARPATWRYEPGGGQQQDLENGAHHRQVLVSAFRRPTFETPAPAPALALTSSYGAHPEPILVMSMCLTSTKPPTRSDPDIRRTLEVNLMLILTTTLRCARARPP